MHRLILVGIAGVVSACVSPSALLVNDKGEQVRCQAQGFGIISGTMANNRFEECVSNAQMKGYKIKEESR